MKPKPVNSRAAIGFLLRTNLKLDFTVFQSITISYVFFLMALSPNHHKTDDDDMKITLASIVALPPASDWKYKIPRRQMRVNVKIGLTNRKKFTTNCEAVPMPVSCV